MNKVVIIGLGFVGKAYAYSLINQNKIDELVLIDQNEEILKGNYIDLNDAAVLSNIKIKIGDYKDCENAKLVVLTAGKNQEKNESRLHLLKENQKIIRSIVKNVMDNNFNGIFLVATNPVDICTHLVLKYSNLKENQVIGSGTLLDTLRLKRLISEKLEIETQNIDTVVLGEHGDSSFPLWSNTKICDQNAEEYLNEKEKNELEEKMHQVAYEIINKKGETSFGIALALSYITNIIIEDKKEKIPVSSNNSEICISRVFLVGKEGIEKNIELSMSDEEQRKYDKSKTILIEAIQSLEE